MTAAPDLLKRIQYWSVVTFTVVLPIGKSLSEAALILGLAAWVARTTRAGRWGQQLRNPLVACMLLWLLAAMGSFTNTIDPVASLHGLRKLFKYFAFCLLVYDTARTPRAFSGILAGCAVGMSLVVADGFWQVLTGKDFIYGHIPTYAVPSGEPVLRVMAMFSHSASLAIHLVSFIPVLLAFGLVGDVRWRRPLLGLSVLAVIILVLCRTRGGILGFVLALPLLSVWLRHWGPVATAVAAAGLQWLTIPPAVKAWSATMPTLLHQLTQPERLMYWQAALNMVSAHPVVGVGVNTFTRAYPLYRIPADQTYVLAGPYAHNQYLHLMAESGALGLCALLAVLVLTFMAFQRCLARRAQAPFNAVAAAGLMAGVVGYLVLGLVESSLFYGQGSMTFWLLIGLIMAMDARGESP